MGKTLLATAASAAALLALLEGGDPGEPTARAVAPVEAALPLGMNLSIVSPSNRELVFVDAFQSAGDWQVTAPDEPGGAARRGRRPHDGPAFELGPDGWPVLPAGATVTGQVFTSMDGHYPGGTYVCTWTGTGNVDLQRAARVVRRGDHRLEALVDPTRGPIVVRFRSTSEEDPVRDLHLWMPGFEGAASPFHPAFVERLRPFRVIRFGNWMRTFSSRGRWESRPRPDGLSQSGRDGVAVEYMVELCNELGSSPWFCMPHTADEAYVRGFATLVHEHLAPGLPVYVELSNEVWNDIFPQARWAYGQAKERGIRAPEVTAEAARAQWRIWRDVFGEDADRIVRVAAGHLHDPNVARVLLESLDGEVDALAVGAYFGIKPEREGFDRTTGAREILAAARRNLETLVFERLEEHARLARAASDRSGHEIRLLAYEGGQHIVAKASLGTRDQRLALSPAEVTACQVLPEMADAYRVLLEGCRDRGVSLFCAYDLAGRRSPGDSFGHLEYIEQPVAQAPKYRALVEWADGHRESPSEDP